MLFLTPEIIDHITQQTNLHVYAKRDEIEQNFCIDTEDMSRFIGLLLISGYHKLPRENDYWPISTSRKTPIFARTISREKFKAIKRFLHIADNQILTTSKLLKSSQFEMLKKQCQQFGIFDEFMSIDESMVPFSDVADSKCCVSSPQVFFIRDTAPHGTAPLKITF